MKVLLLTDGIYPFVIGGMQKHSFNLVSNLLKAKVDLTVVYCGYPGVKDVNETDLIGLLGDTKNLKLKFVPFNSNGMFPGHYIRNCKTYSEDVYQSVENDLEQFDIIYAKGFSGWQLLLQREIEKIIIKAHILVNFHGYEMFQKPSNYIEFLKLRMFKASVLENLRLADTVVSYGGKISTILKSKCKIQSHKILEIPGGIQESKVKSGVNFNGEISEPIKFLFVGRNERRKGIIELKQAIEKLKQENHKAIFSFVGPIPIESRIKKCKSSVVVNYFGEVKDADKVLEIMDEHHVLLTPSHSEGMPNVILEGMARGMCIFATDVGAVSSIVNRDNGWLVSDVKSDTIYNQLIDILKLDRDIIKKKRLSSLKKVKGSFTWNLIIEQHLQHFKRLIGN